MFDSNMFTLLAEAEVGKHFYWNLAGFLVHGQVLVVIWFVFLLLLIFAVLGSSNAERIPHGFQNFMESAVEFVTDIAKDQLGESFYKEWIPFIGTLFFFIFGCNWAGAIIPWKLIELPEGEFAAVDQEVYATDPDGGYDTNAIIVQSLDDMMEGTTRVMEEYATGNPVRTLSKGEGKVIEAEVRAEQAAESAAEMADDFDDFE